VTRARSLDGSTGEWMRVSVLLTVKLGSERSVHPEGGDGREVGRVRTAEKKGGCR
jgi:hypothetical protein